MPIHFAACEVEGGSFLCTEVTSVPCAWTALTLPRTAKHCCVLLTNAALEACTSCRHDNTCQLWAARHIVYVICDSQQNMYI